MTQTVANATDVQEQVKRDYRWNFTVNALDGTSFWFGMSFIYDHSAPVCYSFHYESLADWLDSAFRYQRVSPTPAFYCQCSRACTQEKILPGDNWLLP